jgi:hypothetical protein
MHDYVNPFWPRQDGYIWPHRSALATRLLGDGVGETV